MATTGRSGRRRASRLLAIAAALLTILSAPRSPAFETKTAPFAIAFKEEVSAYRQMSAFVLPGASLNIEAVGGPTGDYALDVNDGTTTSLAARKWKWRAPDAPGHYELRFDAPDDKHAITLHVFVMVPAREVNHGLLNGYRIGDYPAKPLKGNPIYLPPSGFVEVTKDNQDTHVTPHFRLKQFLCKEDTTKDFPKYVVIKERLLLKLEAVLQLVNARGFHVDTLHVMSAYRTPYYNRAIGDVLYSMHQWGSAADVFVDKDNKGRMDDLTRDGIIDIRDSRYLYDAIEDMLSERPFQKFQGGMGFYRGTSAHPPFVHVDVRGTKARWQG